MAEEDVDFAVAAYRDDGRWHVVELHPMLAEDVAELSEALARFPSDVGVLGIVAVDDDFFVIMRRWGTEVRAMLSDVTAAEDWPLAAGIAELLDLDTDDDEPLAVGDVAILSDLGISGPDLRALCDDEDLYPEDILMDVAGRIGFAAQLEAVIG
ncbi:hypothetical protein GEV29_02990 [Aeromicrobium sp. SMF47]|uniref:Uncharacterized protein n=1 Tax=Aeromicrobium yanjiei TaxID=2662028 RepID=A0A5Q2MBZ8_9ACTN|nr:MULTISPECIES: tRNA adenosine deaminase-associated protein [Aeromicrobium]MRJ75491.1 hypothetical protein [Aeromicrobium yanjiei]MRK02484.1 hypothetical protein [Aeromicrobium sp. S22]QGG40088.1 hypothetical protein GEV26_01090 [Aeromicrobium yanjiei]